jgi:hypothetical protein
MAKKTKSKTKAKTKKKVVKKTVTPKKKVVAKKKVAAPKKTKEEAKLFTPEELKGKFVIVTDTLCQGNMCMMDEDEQTGVRRPLLFDSEDEAFAEIFDSNHSMLESHDDDDMLEEYNEGVTSEMVEEMGEILQSGDVARMRKFMDEHPECDDSGEYTESAEEFIYGRRLIFGNNGGQVTGVKLVDLVESDLQD